MADGESGADERTEEATTQRREDFRKRGQVAQSRELASVLILFASSLAIWALSRFFFEQITETYRLSMTDFVVTAAREGDIASAGHLAFKNIALILGPLFLISIIVSFLSSVLQIGFIFNEEAIQFDFNGMNPINGLQRILSLHSAVEGFKALLKVSIVILIAFFIIRNDLLSAPLLIHFGVNQLFAHIGDVIIRLLFGVGLFMLVLAILDYGYQKWDLEQKMRMTKQEVKEEHKSREGDPLIKARIRRIQREMANRRMMEAVPKADVIVTNPTHIAVALKYENDMPSPKVIAMGGDLLAEKIKQVARDNKIPIVENKPLARTIFKTLKIGQFIPRELFNAVAEVLAYVYRLRRKAVI